VADRKRLQQAVANRIQHGIQVGFRVQLAGELHQRAAIIVTVAIEVFVEPLLNPVADRLEQEGSHQHHRDQAGVAHILEVLLHQAAEREHDAVERRQHANRRQRVRIPAPEENIDVHQPVARDGIGQGQRDERQRKDRKPHILVGQHPQRIGRDVQDRKRQDAAEGPVAQPLQLLAHDGVFGFAVCQAQHQSAQQVGKHQQRLPDAVEHPAQFQQRDADLQGAGGDRQPKRKEQRGR